MDPAALRHVVTGVAPDGRSVVLAQAAPRLVPSGAGWIAERWRSQDDGGAWQVAPPPGGAAFRLVEFAPAGEPGCRSSLHATATVDCLVVVSGRVWLCLAGEEVELAPGDTAVQHATTHRWENRAPQPCLLAVFLLSRETP